MGVTNTNQLGTPYQVAQIILHEQYINATLKNDIAILRLATPINPLPTATANTACLSPQGQSFVGQK